MNANIPKPKHVFMLVHQNGGYGGHRAPWALISAEWKDWPPENYMPMATFTSKAEGIACLKYCIAAAEMDDSEKETHP
jgi:hypothetical protein